uniref:Uncharacterized protein n=1 Tax=Pipistrellus kuhlii TaxID=59472 RepID=A0A7J8B1D9_PIPKU|nr:hypothetical protein mPipKuh1_007688 [Pipistrellus kuhlii]
MCLNQEANRQPFGVWDDAQLSHSSQTILFLTFLCPFSSHALLICLIQQELVLASLQDFLLFREILYVNFISFPNCVVLCLFLFPNLSHLLLLHLLSQHLQVRDYHVESTSLPLWTWCTIHQIHVYH